jgi:hypothetical protein
VTAFLLQVTSHFRLSVSIGNGENDRRNRRFSPASERKLF